MSVRTAIPVAPEGAGQGGPPPRRPRVAARGAPATSRTPAQLSGLSDIIGFSDFNDAILAEMSARL